MNYAKINKNDIANGVGIRVTLFVSGCTHKCPGCFNKEAWDFNYGSLFTRETEEEILNALQPYYINGLTLLGGEPMEPSNQKVLVSLLKRIKEELPNKTIWCFTGYTLETDLLRESRARCNVTDEMLSYIDVLVDGEFIEEKKDISLLFRGSFNQRLINLRETLKENKIVFWKHK